MIPGSKAPTPEPPNSGQSSAIFREGPESADDRGAHRITELIRVERPVEKTEFNSHLYLSEKSVERSEDGEASTSLSYGGQHSVRHEQALIEAADPHASKSVAGNDGSLFSGRDSEPGKFIDPSHSRIQSSSEFPSDVRSIQSASDGALPDRSPLFSTPAARGAGQDVSEVETLGSILGGVPNTAGTNAQLFSESLRTDNNTSCPALNPSDQYVKIEHSEPDHKTPVDAVHVQPVIEMPVDVVLVDPVIDAPVEVIHADPAIEAPVDVAQADPVIDAPVDVVHADPVIETPVDVVLVGPVIDTPVDVVQYDPIIERPVEVVQVEPAIELPVEVVQVEPAIDAAVDVVQVDPVTDAPVEVIQADPAMDIPVEVVHADPVVDSPVDVVHADPVIDAPVDIIDEAPIKVSATLAEAETSVETIRYSHADEAFDARASRTSSEMREENYEYSDTYSSRLAEKDEAMDDSHFAKQFAESREWQKNFEQSDADNSAIETRLSYREYSGARFEISKDEYGQDQKQALATSADSAEHVFGKDGTDTLSYAGDTEGVTVYLAKNYAEGGDAKGYEISGFENVTGGSGDDTLVGDQHNNVIQGGAGADRLIGGDGTDTLSYAGDTEGVTVYLGKNYAEGGDAKGDEISGFENVTGGSRDDTLVGDQHNNVIQGGAGADVIDGGAGFDTASYATSRSGVTIDLSMEHQKSEGDAHGDILMNVEKVVGSSFDDILRAANHGSVLSGGAGNDVLLGGAGDDVLQGGSGHDLFVFSGDHIGHDKVDGGAGWTDQIDLTNVHGDWTIALDDGSKIVNSDDHSLALTHDASGYIQFSDGSEIAFHAIERIQF